MVQFGGSDAQWNRDMNDGWCRNEFKQGFHSDVVLRLREYTTVTCLKISYTGSTYSYIVYNVFCSVNRFARKAWMLQTVGKERTLRLFCKSSKPVSNGLTPIARWLQSRLMFLCCTSEASICQYAEIHPGNRARMNSDNDDKDVYE